MFVQLPVIGVRNEQAVVIKKVDLLLVAHADIRMFAQKIMQRRGTGFLRTGDDEIEQLNLATPGSKHRHRARNRAHARARVHDRLRSRARAGPEEPMRSGHFPRELVAITPALYAPRCRTFSAGFSYLPFLL